MCNKRKEALHIIKYHSHRNYCIFRICACFETHSGRLIEEYIVFVIRALGGHRATVSYLYSGIRTRLFLNNR